MKRLFQRTILFLERPTVPLANYFLTFLFAATLRSLLEFASDNTGIFPLRFIHYYLAYISLASVLTVLFYYATRERLDKILRVILPSFIILLLPPAIDLLLTKGRGMNIAYILPGKNPNLLLKYLTFFGDFPGVGVTPGIRIEIFLVLVASFFYFYYKNQKVLKSIAFVLLMYTVFFWLAASPVLIKHLLALSALNYEYSDRLLYNFHLVLITILALWITLIFYRSHFMVILRDIRFYRFLHFQLMLLLGFILGLRNQYFVLDQDSLFSLLFSPLCVLFAGLHAVILNNIEDYGIDVISNVERPLVKKTIDIDSYRALAWCFLLISTAYAASISFIVFFCILVFAGNYYLYSMPPLRLKRVTFLSKALIALSTLAVTVIGFAVSGSPIREFPERVAYYYLICFTMVINFIDIKDYEGDRLNGIKTLPVVLGLRNSKILIGIFFILAYSGLSLIMEDSFAISFGILVPALLFGAIIFYQLNKRVYREKDVFRTYIVSLVLFLILLTYLIGQPGPSPDNHQEGGSSPAVSSSAVAKLIRVQKPMS